MEEEVCEHHFGGLCKLSFEEDCSHSFFGFDTGINEEGEIVMGTVRMCELIYLEFPKGGQS